MQKTKIDWVIAPDGSAGFTSNPVSGCLGPGGTLENPRRCAGCYAMKIAARWGKTDVARAFLPEFHPGRLKQIERRKKPTTIFVCSMADLWGEWVPWNWIAKVLDVVLRCPQHRFIFLTKNPGRYRKFTPFPNNVWVGSTTRTQPEFDADALEMEHVEAPVRFISAEPMLGPIQLSENGWRPDWIIIGDMTKNGRPMGRTTDEWVLDLTAQAARHKIPVFHKDSLHRGFTLREFPVQEERP